MKISKKLTLDKMKISRISDLGASHIQGGTSIDIEIDGGGKSVILLHLCKTYIIPG